MSYAELEMKVVQWSEARKIIPNSTPFAQSIKAVEEINELVDALRDNNKVDAVDAIGDTVVCLINVCALLDVNLTDCLGLLCVQLVQADRKVHKKEGRSSKRGKIIRYRGFQCQLGLVKGDRDMECSCDKCEAHLRR